MHGRVVVKFGGADLATGEKISQAAQLVAQSPYKEIVVVVSAMGKMTDSLVESATLIGVSEEDYADIISMGERTSARVFCSSLRAQGLNAELFDPGFQNWPIITDSNYLNAKPDLEKTLMLTDKEVKPKLGKSVPVMCGFLGKDKNGKITTLGRGGSDTTALLIAKCIGADEIILVKETSGVMSADPKIVPEAKPLNKLDIHEMFDLAQGGAKIIKPEALKYKQPDQTMRIVNFASGNLAEGGTQITGSFNLNSVETQCHEGLIAINIICEVNAQNIREIFSSLNQKPVYGVSSGRKSVTVFTTDGDVGQVLKRLHAIDGFKAISHREKVAMIQLSHPQFIDSPGGIAKISAALSRAGINIIEVTTSKATINVFIEENQLKKAQEAINDVV